MTVQDAVDAMNAALLSAWTAAGLLAEDVRWTDIAGAALPDSNKVWCRVTVRHADGFKRVLSVGANTHENTGTYWVQIFSPIGVGNVQGYAAVQAVVTAFRDSNGGVWFRNVRLKEVGTSGAFEQTNVLADFSYDN
jgi:hypothetical protein